MTEAAHPKPLKEPLAITDAMCLGDERSADDLLTAEDVAAVLRVTPAWVYAETRSGRIPHLRLGCYVRYRRRALDDWMQRVETPSSSPRRSPVASDVVPLR